MKYSEQIELYTDETSLCKIAEDLSAKEYPAYWYQEQIDAWFGIVIELDDDREAQLTFSYIVQNVMQSEKADIKIKPTELILRSRQQAKDFIANHAYVFATAEAEPGEGKRTGPSKKEQSAAIYTANVEEGRGAVIKALVEELGMTKAGAGTYYNNFKSGKWELE